MGSDINQKHYVLNLGHATALESSTIKWYWTVSGTHSRKMARIRYNGLGLDWNGRVFGVEPNRGPKTTRWTRSRLPDSFPPDQAQVRTRFWPLLRHMLTWPGPSERGSHHQNITRKIPAATNRGAHTDYSFNPHSVSCSYFDLFCSNYHTTYCNFNDAFNPTTYLLDWLHMHHPLSQLIYILSIQQPIYF